MHGRSGAARLSLLTGHRATVFHPSVGCDAAYLASMLRLTCAVPAVRVGAGFGERRSSDSVSSTLSLDGVFAVGVDVGVFRELLGGVVDEFRVPDACVRYLEGPSHGPGSPSRYISS